MWKKYGDLQVHRSGKIVGSSGVELTQKLDGKLRPYITVKRKRISVASLVARVWLPKPGPDQTHLIHRDYDPRHCNASNLKWGTADEYAFHWGSKVGPPTVKAVRATRMPEEFYVFVFANEHKGLRTLKELLHHSEWHDHGVSDFYLQSIIKGRIRRDLFLKHKLKRYGKALPRP